VSFAKFSSARTLTALAIMGLFLLPLLGVKALIGGLAGSLLFGWVNLLDVFAFAENLLSSRSISLAALYAVAPLVLAYLILGRVFCGWVCPLDLIFRGIDRLQRRGGRPAHPVTAAEGVFSLPPRPKNSKLWRGTLIPIGFLAAAASAQIPFFTVYFSPITNFYRGLCAGVFCIIGLPGEISVLMVSILVLAAFSLLDYFRPRLWCRNLCPVGRVYGLFSRVSLLHLELNPERCNSCRSCEEACYMGVRILSPPAREKIRDSSCILCGRCVEACPTQKAALTLRFGK